MGPWFCRVPYKKKDAMMVGLLEVCDELPNLAFYVSAYS